MSADTTGRQINLLPIGIPVLGLFCIASLMFFMSRILLAVPEQASTFIALAVAVIILGDGHPPRPPADHLGPHHGRRRWAWRAC